MWTVALHLTKEDVETRLCPLSDINNECAVQVTVRQGRETKGVS